MSRTGLGSTHETSRRVPLGGESSQVFLESAQPPKPGTKRGIRNLDGPSRVLGNSCTPESGQPPALSLTVQCVRLPPVLLNRYRSILFFFFASCGNSESWKVETAITLPVVTSMHVSRTRNALSQAGLRDLARR